MKKYLKLEAGSRVTYRWGHIWHIRYFSSLKGSPSDNSRGGVRRRRLRTMTPAAESPHENTGSGAQSRFLQGAFH
jgi:hypothetical protein